ncbi:MAG: type IX secretion system sortase PorU [Saprospiraceae bacterium]|nr:type IX secretion system sortase PorU [Saprospiraceae bacterium]
MKLKFILFFSLSSIFLSAQQSFQIQEQLKWTESKERNGQTKSTFGMDFLHSTKSSKFQGLPVFKKEFELPSFGELKATLIPKKSSSQSISVGPEILASLESEFQFQAEVLNERNHYYASIELIPIRKISNSGSIDILNDFEIQIQFFPTLAPPPLPNYTNQSVLTNGVWHKFSITQRGVYKIDKSFLEKNLKLDFNTIDPRNIRIYGNGGMVLPESTDGIFEDDLKEQAIFIKGEEDGKFDDTDFILFYANGPDSYSYDPSVADYVYSKNPYSDVAYYFIKTDNVAGKRISTVASIPNPDYQSKLTYDFKHLEKDLVNLLDVDPGGEGSGKNWYGEEISNSRELDYGSEFIFNNIDFSKNGKFSFSFAGRAPVSTQVSAIVEQTQVDVPISYVFYSSINRFANIARKTTEFQAVSDLVKAKIKYPQINGTVSEGWIDYMQISVWRKLIWNNKLLYILDPTSTNFNTTNFTISNVSSDKLIWDITNPLDVSRISSQKINDQLYFSVPTLNSIKQFVVLDENLNFESPTYVGIVGNQNLHSLKDEEMIILYHKDYKSEAERLQAHRSKFSNLKIAAVELGQVYNEFSSGSQDPSAIRNFMRMLYLRNPNFKYLAILGDGSYDFRHINKKDEDQNFVITYETDESLDPITAFPTDDYFGLLDPGEGLNLTGKLDINIGRLGARNPAEAKNLVDKIIRYDSDPLTMEEWKLNVLFSSDDEDSNTHFTQAETIAKSVGTNFPVLNQEKIHLDAYEQITTPGGERYPAVNKAFSNAFYQGALVINYMGHGGYSGLAQERILQNTDIKVLENYYKLPLVIVASCTFNGFDDPTKTNAGEEGLHNAQGGFLALFSTVRAVYSDDNFDLTSSVYKYLFNFENGKPLPLGEIMRRAKNEHSGSFIRTNSRKFLLFGDPAQSLALPLYKNAVISINEKPISQVLDTFRALETVNVKGIVTNQAGLKQSDFTGKLFVTIYDKEINLRTKANDPTSYVANYNLQRNILYKGLVAVNQGDWNFTFTVPKDINYEFGKGKMSLYATDEKTRDAAGYEDAFIIGGVSKDSIRDDNPPIVKVFLNDANFTNGGISDPNPKIYSQISDDFGINISGNSIGHDLTAIIDLNSQAPIILNQVYKSKLNNPKEGELYYPLKNLSPGKHTITIIAWDISNNSGQGSLEFFVVDPSQTSLERIYNYPNPFSSNTEFQFETNIGATEMDIVIQIQSVSGKLVKTISKTIQASGYRIDGIQWDGKDDFGNDLANGVYLYRLSMNAKTGNEVIHKRSDFQKLVLLK